MDVIGAGFLVLGAVALVLIAAYIFRSRGGQPGKVLAEVRNEAGSMFSVRDSRTPGAILDLLNEVGDWLVANTDLTTEERAAAVDGLAKHLTHKRAKPAAV